MRNRPMPQTRRDPDVGRPVGRGSSRLVRPALGVAGIVVAALMTGITSAGASSSLPQVDPATVPQGELALESQVGTPFSMEIGGKEHDFKKGAEVTVEHDQFPVGATSGWHAHSGPLFVTVVSGTLTLYEAKDEKCKGKAYNPGTGFLEPGFGNVHDARNEGTVPVEIYISFLLPLGSGDNGLFIPKPDFSNPDCPFAN